MSYKLNKKNKTITVDINKLSAEDEKIVQMYVLSGYIIKKPRKGTLTYDLMRKELSKDHKDNATNEECKKLLNELNKKIQSKENYMKVKKWFKESYKY